MKYTILHIEDDPSMIGLVKMAFNGFGFRGEMLSADSVKTALDTLDERARLQKPLSLILSDMQLPDGTCLDVIRAVKSDFAWRLTPVVVLSGEKSDKMISDSYAFGANCFLPKATSSKPILSTLRSLYDCWLDSAVLPEGTPAGHRLHSILARGIQNRTRMANVCMDLAQAFAGTSLQMRFWLDRALNEGNIANLAVFFQRILGKFDLPHDDAEQITQYQNQFETALSAAERFLKDNPMPTMDESFAKILDILESEDTKVFAKFLRYMLPVNPIAAKALQSSMMDHFTIMASFIAEQAEPQDLRARATTQQIMAGKIKAALSS